ncbi:MAG: PDZ domain-containing protein, partial [Calditrichia bacterium]
GLKVKKGLIITRIEKGSPAQKAGLQEEDVVVELNGQKIESRNDFINILAGMDLKVGDELEFTVVRVDKEMKFKVKLEAHPE